MNFTVPIAAAAAAQTATAFSFESSTATKRTVISLVVRGHSISCLSSSWSCTSSVKWDESVCYQYNTKFHCWWWCCLRCWGPCCFNAITTNDHHNESRPSTATVSPNNRTVITHVGLHRSLRDEFLDRKSRLKPYQLSLWDLRFSIYFLVLTALSWQRSRSSQLGKQTIRCLGFRCWYAGNGTPSGHASETWWSQQTLPLPWKMHKCSWGCGTSYY